MSTAILKFTSVPVTSKYGPRPRFTVPHKGVDTATGTQYPHSVFGDGVVTFAGRQPYYIPGTKKVHPDYERGIHVIVKHAPGIETSYHSLSKLNVKTGDVVRMGDIIGWAGESAVGANGNHVHNGLWLDGEHVDPLAYLTPGKAVTVTTNTTAGNGATPLDNTEDDMFTDADRAKLNNAYAGIFDGASVEIDGEVQKFNYGILPVVVHNQTLIARQAGQIAALSAAVSAISGGTPINLTAIEAAAEKGAREALDGLTFKAEVS